MRFFTHMGPMALPLLALLIAPNAWSIFRADTGHPVEREFPERPEARAEAEKPELEIDWTSIFKTEAEFLAARAEHFGAQTRQEAEERDHIKDPELRNPGGQSLEPVFPSEDMWNRRVDRQLSELDPNSDPNGLKQCMIEKAQEQIGKKYVLGTQGDGDPKTFDCSGLIHWLLTHDEACKDKAGQLGGVDRFTTQNMKEKLGLQPVAGGCQNAGPGDLMWWPKNGSGFGHVALVAASGSAAGMTIEASGDSVKKGGYRNRSGRSPECFSLPDTGAAPAGNLASLNSI